MQTLSQSRSIAINVLTLLLMLVFTACDGRLNGTYTSDGGSFLISSMTFKPGGKVEVTAMGVTQEVNYEVEGKKVKVMAENKSATIFTIDDNGCLDGGRLIGKFCKN